MFPFLCNTYDIFPPFEASILLLWKDNQCMTLKKAEYLNLTSNPVPAYEWAKRSTKQLLVFDLQIYVIWTILNHLFMHIKTVIYLRAMLVTSR
jgi:hypothetical protein